MIPTEGQILATLFTLWTLPTNGNYTHIVVGREGHVARHVALQYIQLYVCTCMHILH